MIMMMIDDDDADNDNNDHNIDRAHEREGAHPRGQGRRGPPPSEPGWMAWAWAATRRPDETVKQAGGRRGDAT